MQILTINNRNFEKPSRTKVKIWAKKMFGIAHKKKLVPCMLSHRKSGKNQRKIIEIFFEN